MYNVRKKLWFLMVLLFIAGALMSKIYPDTAAVDVLSTSVSSADRARETGNVFDESGEKFVAHRGYSNYAPENSIPAFTLAGKIGFWGIETDISQTNDGQFVCMHDDTIDRTTNGSGSVGDYSLDELNTFLIDSGNNVDTHENLKIPTMEEYLEICAQYNCVPVVEIKKVSDYDAFLQRIIDSGLESRCIVTGTIDDVKEIRARNDVIPVMTIGYTPAPYTDNLQYISEIPDNRGILYNYPQLDEEAVGILRQQNIRCGVWSIDDAEIARQYLDYGVDFIVTNEIPARLSYLVNENE